MFIRVTQLIPKELITATEVILMDDRHLVESDLTFNTENISAFGAVKSRPQESWLRLTCGKVFRIRVPVGRLHELLDSQGIDEVEFV